MRRSTAWVSGAGLVLVLAQPTQASFPGTNGQIAFAQTASNYCPDIGVVNGDGSGRTTITDCPELASDPAWSPDGTKIAFTGAAPNSDPNAGPGAMEIYLLPTDGSGAPQAVTTTAGEPVGASDPAWSPDGTKIAYGSGDSGPGDSTAIKILAPGGTTTLVPASHNGNNQEPDWSPDGATIAFQSRVGPTSVIEAVPAAGGAPAQLTSEDTLDAAYPSWSPDGTKIAFAARPANQGTAAFHIWVMDANGANPGQLSTGPASDVQPSWSPDGTQIAFTRGCGSASEGTCEAARSLFVIPAAGGAGTLVTGGAFDPDWGSGSAVPCDGCAAGGGGTIDRSISLTLSRSLTASGRVKTVGEEFADCVGHQPVKVQRRSGGRWHTLEKVTTRNTGRYSASLPDKRGKYRSVAPRHRVDGGDVVCKAATSPTRQP